MACRDGSQVAERRTTLRAAGLGRAGARQVGIPPLGRMVLERTQPVQDLVRVGHPPPPQPPLQNSFLDEFPTADKECRGIPDDRQK